MITLKKLEPFINEHKTKYCEKKTKEGVPKKEKKKKIKSTENREYQYENVNQRIVHKYRVYK